MKERPILFSAPMVRAILAGTKTQTRRLMKPQPEVTAPDRWGETWSWPSHACRSMVSMRDAPCLSPYGYKRDRLWVKESHAFVPWPSGAESHAPDQDHDRQGVRFRATWDKCHSGRWRPSIHMPRWASRITLEVTGVRVERLHAIAPDDVTAEGITEEDARCDGECGATPCLMLVPAFRQLWHEINGRESWNANPWVWVVEFKRAELAQVAA